MIISGKPGGNGQVEVTFVLPAEQVPGPTSVVGDFNGWDPYAHPLRPAEDGTWRVTAVVPCDRDLCFRYLADGGVWFDDPDADRHDGHGGHLSAERLAMAWADEAARAEARAMGLGVDVGPVERTTFGPVPSL